MKIIIVGAGEVGFHCAQKLSEEGQDVVLIDKDPVQIKHITDNLDVQAITGSGTSPETVTSGSVRG
ncbi:NAD-binding protein [Thermodesulfobacteriota bacterium]